MCDPFESDGMLPINMTQASFSRVTSRNTVIAANVLDDQNAPDHQSRRS